MIKKFLLFIAIAIFNADVKADLNIKDLYKSVVRVRMQSNSTDAEHCGGTGTIVKLKENRGLVLTAAHIIETIKNYNDEAFIYIERFEFRDKYLRLTDIHSARVLSSNIESDVAFLEFNFSNDKKEEKRPQMSAIAPTFPKKSSDVEYITIGCPTLYFPNRTSARIMSVNCNSSIGGLNHNKWHSYALGFLAEKGRSGSPLFNEDGAVIGLLSYTERHWYKPELNASIYVAGPTIMEELTKLEDWHP